MLSRSALFASAVGLLALAGCGPAKLNETKTVTLDGVNTAQTISLPAQPKPQTVTVDFSSSEKEVRVLVFKKDDIKDADAAVTAGAQSALAAKQGQTGNFAVEVPANTAVAVVVRDAQAKKTDVTIKLTNSK